MENVQPKLRFPEFKDEWGNDILGKITIKIQDGNYGAKYPKADEFISEGIPFLTSKVLGKTGKINHHLIDYISVKKHNELNKAHIQTNDILLTNRGASFGVIGIVPKELNDGNIGPQLTLIRCNNNYNPFFIYQQLKSDKINNEILKMDSGSAMNFVGIETTKKIQVSTTDLPEQTKIADFLGRVDKQLELLTTKKEKLQLYKKGVMQKLFSQEIRFTKEDGTNYPDWEEKTFGELYEFNPTNSFSRDKLNYDDGEIMNIHYGDIHTNFKSQFNIDNEIVPFINRDVKINSNHKFVDNGDIIIADASENLEDIGKAIEVLNIGNKKILSGLHTLHAKPQNSNLYFGFMSYLLKSKDFRKQVQFIAQGTKVLSITGTRIAKIKFNLPSIEEQTKIADFLIAIDNQIDAIDNQITKTENYKKGLLQQMFV